MPWRLAPVADAGADVARAGRGHEQAPGPVARELRREKWPDRKFLLTNLGGNGVRVDRPA